MNSKLTSKKKTSGILALCVVCLVVSVIGPLVLLAIPSSGGNLRDQDVFRFSFKQSFLDVWVVSACSNALLLLDIMFTVTSRKNHANLEPESIAEMATQYLQSLSTTKRILIVL